MEKLSGGSSLKLQSGSSSLLEWAVASATHPGEVESGDAYLVQPFDGGVLVAAVDGVGHGVDAALASQRAIEAMAESGGRSVIAIVQSVHAALSGSRGVVMSLASFDEGDGTMSWIGVGNVNGVLLRADPLAVPRRETILARGGILGQQLPQLRATITPVSYGDTLFFATDGVRSGFADHVDSLNSAQTLASHILDGNAKGADDALILVGRYKGTPGKPR